MIPSLVTVGGDFSGLGSVYTFLLNTKVLFIYRRGRNWECWYILVILVFRKESGLLHVRGQLCVCVCVHKHVT